MPRKARVKSESGIYHIMLRGINQQQIFEDQEDYDKFIEIVTDCKAICGFKIYAYCLMGNHIHLLIKEGEEGLEQMFKRIGGRFVYWYNIKYRRVGHLFQDRFKSEPVETEEYFFTVLRYIHQNPVKANICKKVGDYPYSSYRDYVRERKTVDIDYVLEILSLDSFIEYHNQTVDANCLDICDKVIVRVTDEQAKELIKKYAKCDSVSDFQDMDIKTRDKCLKKLRDQGVSIRQLSRLTGISFSVIRKL